MTMTDAERADFERRAIANRQPLKPHHIESTDEFYERRARELSEKNKAKQAAPPSGLSAYYSGQREVEQQAEQARREAVASGPYAAQVDLLHLPPRDPLLLQAKWRFLNGDAPYPGDDKIK